MSGYYWASAGITFVAAVWSTYNPKVSWAEKWFTAGLNFGITGLLAYAAVKL